MMAKQTDESVFTVPFDYAVLVSYAPGLPKEQSYHTWALSRHQDMSGRRKLWITSGYKARQELN